MSSMPITRNTPLTQPLIPPEPRAGGEPAAQIQPNPAQAQTRAGQIYPQNAAVQGLRGGALEAAQALPDQATAPLPPNITSVRLGATDTVALLPLDGVRGPDAAEKVQAYVNRGMELYRQIMRAGDQPALMPAPGKKDVAALTWYLQALGSARAAASSGHPDGPAMFKEGSFMLEDPQGTLEAYLRSANSYARKSSHLKDFQAAGEAHRPVGLDVQGGPRHPFWEGAYKPRGVDVRGVETPHGRRTILFQPLLPQGEGPHALAGTGHRMLFVKMEPHGCRGFSTEGGVSGREAGFFKKLRRFFSNISDSIGHLFGFLESVRQRSGAAAIIGQNNRERIPSDIQRDYKQIQSAAEPAAQGILRQGNPLSDSSGIRQMRANLQALASDLTREQTPVEEALLAKLNRYDQADLRIGGEIILLQGDPLLQERPQAEPEATQAAPEAPQAEPEVTQAAQQDRRP